MEEKDKEILIEICKKNKIEFEGILKLIESTKVKKLVKRMNYHTETIDDVITKEIK